MRETMLLAAVGFNQVLIFNIAVLNTIHPHTQFKLNKLVVFVLLLGAITACKKSAPTNNSINLGYSFFPIDSGIVKYYAVDSIAYSDITHSSDTFHFILKEEFAGLISGQTFQYHREILRSVRTDTSQNWHARTSVFVIVNSNNLEWLEDNIRQVKLAFPIGNVLSWNGNQSNNLGRKTFLLQNIHQAFNNGDTEFNDCVAVQESLANNAIEEILIKSVYSNGIGLIDFTNNNLNTQVTGVSGYKIHQKLIHYYLP